MKEIKDKQSDEVVASEVKIEFDNKQLDFEELRQLYIDEISEFQ